MTTYSISCKCSISSACQLYITSQVKKSNYDNYSKMERYSLSCAHFPLPLSLPFLSPFLSPFPLHFFPPSAPSFSLSLLSFSLNLCSLSLSPLPSSRRKPYSRDYRQCGVGYTLPCSRVWRWPSNTATTSTNHTLERYATQQVCRSSPHNLPELLLAYLLAKDIVHNSINTMEYMQALNIWENVCNMIEVRESQLEELQTFENTAYNPSSFIFPICIHAVPPKEHSGSSSSRLQEAKARR